MNTNDWIVAKDFTPEAEKSQDVLAFVPSKNFSGYYVAHWDGSKFISCPPPTHWMPLPEPPAEPDPFEEFWNGLPICNTSPQLRWIGANALGKTETAYIWDAAMKAKEGK